MTKQRAHSSKQTQKMVTSLKWESLPHPSNSTDLAPTDIFGFNPEKLSWLIHEQRRARKTVFQTFLGATHRFL